MFGTLRRYGNAPNPLWFFAILAAFSLSLFLFGLVLMTPAHAGPPDARGTHSASII